MTSKTILHPETTKLNMEYYTFYTLLQMLQYTAATNYLIAFNIFLA